MVIEREDEQQLINSPCCSSVAVLLRLKSSGDKSEASRRSLNENVFYRCPFSCLSSFSCSSSPSSSLSLKDTEGEDVQRIFVFAVFEERESRAAGSSFHSRLPVHSQIKSTRRRGGGEEEPKQTLHDNKKYVGTCQLLGYHKTLFPATQNVTLGARSPKNLLCPGTGIYWNRMGRMWPRLRRLSQRLDCYSATHSSSFA